MKTSLSIMATCAATVICLPYLAERIGGEKFFVAESDTSLVKTTDQNLHLASDKSRWMFASGVLEGSRPVVPLRFLVAGRLDNVDVVEGQRVRRQEILAKLDATDWKHQVAKAKASLELALAKKDRVQQGASQEARTEAIWQAKVAEAQVELHESTYKRRLELKESVAVTVEELDEAEAQLNTARAQWAAARARSADLQAPPRSFELRRADAEIASARANLAEAETTLSKAELRAPCNGVVLQVDVERGELTGPESRDSVITIVDDSELRVRAYVEERDAVHVCEGQRAYVTADGMGGQKFMGEVIACLPLMRPKTYFNNRPDERNDVKIREVLIRLDNNQETDRLVVGLPLDVHIEHTESSGDQSRPDDPLREQFQVANSNAPALPTGL